MEENQLKYEKEGKAFISSNIEYQGYDEYNFYFSGVKLMPSAVFTIIYGMLIIFVFKHLPVLPTLEAFGILGGLVLVYSLIVQKIIRITVLDEDRLLYSYKKGYGTEAGLSMSDIWDMYSFDDDTRTAKLYNMASGKLIRVKRSSIIGKDENFKKQDQLARENFYNKIYSNNLRVIRYNRFEGVESTDELNVFGEKIQSHPNENLKALLQIQNGYMKNETKFRSRIEVDYYFIYAISIKDYEKLEEIPNILACLSDAGGYTHIDILDYKSYMNFETSLTGVEYADISILKAATNKKLYRYSPVTPIALFTADMKLIKKFDVEPNTQKHTGLFDTKSKKKFNTKKSVPATTTTTDKSKSDELSADEELKEPARTTNTKLCADKKDTKKGKDKQVSVSIKENLNKLTESAKSSAVETSPAEIVNGKVVESEDISFSLDEF